MRAGASLHAHWQSLTRRVSLAILAYSRTWPIACEVGHVGHVGGDGSGEETPPLQSKQEWQPFLVMIHVLAYPASQKEQMHHSKGKGDTLRHDMWEGLDFYDKARELYNGNFMLHRV